MPFLEIIPEVVDFFRLRKEIDRFDMTRVGITAEEMENLMLTLKYPPSEDLACNSHINTPANFMEKSKNDASDF